jgi:hypothetical protein
MVTRYCDEHKIPYKKCGKLIIAVRSQPTTVFSSVCCDHPPQDFVLHPPIGSGGRQRVGWAGEVVSPRSRTQPHVMHCAAVPQNQHHALRDRCDRADAIGRSRPAERGQGPLLPVRRGVQEGRIPFPSRRPPVTRKPPIACCQQSLAPLLRRKTKAEGGKAWRGTWFIQLVDLPRRC